MSTANVPNGLGPRHTIIILADNTEMAQQEKISVLLMVTSESHQKQLQLLLYCAVNH